MTVNVVTIVICVLTIVVCLYTLYKTRNMASTTANNYRDIKLLNEHDRQLLSYIKQIKGEIQDVQKTMAKIKVSK